MNYTDKYHMPQWVKTDRIMMEDFNQMSEDIESGLLKTARDAAAGISGAAADAAAAQATADQAVSAAAAAQAKADAAYAPDQPPYVVGTYKGTGTTQTIKLGFQPSFVIIGGLNSNYQYMYSRAVGGTSGNVTFTSNGFKVEKTVADASGNETPPFLVYPGTSYSYIAFR